MKKTLFRLAGRVAAGLLAVTLVCGGLSCDNDSGKDDNDVVYAPGSTDGTGSSSSNSNSSSGSSHSGSGTVISRSWYCLQLMDADETSSHLSFKPSATACPASIKKKYRFKDCSPAVEVISWREGDTIWYYAEGYTDSGRRIPLSADAHDMFRLCPGLSSIDLSGFDTSNVTNMGYMFWGCSGLTSLDLSGFNTSKVTNMGSMFIGCSRLTTIYASNSFVTTEVSSSTSMFKDCNNLVGGAGTAYNSSNANDHTYAHIDSATNPGYFTAKP